MLAYKQSFLSHFREMARGHDKNTQTTEEHYIDKEEVAKALSVLPLFAEIEDQEFWQKI